ncbi:hypothetical protein ACEE42_03140 [Streptococcus suis]|uniref:hypothetical protein n=1 Tax=Streptococcus suis TaxID=1307 RepID=UPI0014796C6D
MEYNKQEKALLKRFNKVNFREFTKQDILELNSKLDQVDPEVAKAIVAQFPEFLSGAKNTIKEFQDVVDKALESNDVTQKAIFEACQQKLNILERMLDDDHLTFEEKKFYLSEMQEIIEKLDSLNDKNKEWLGKLLQTTGYFIFGSLVIGLTILGVNNKGNK